MSRMVVFTENNARIVYGENLNSSLPHVINPDLRAVLHTPPHFWKLENGQVIPMTEEERLQRLEHHDEFGVVNDITSTLRSVPEQVFLEPAKPQSESTTHLEQHNRTLYLMPTVSFVLGIIVGYLIFKYGVH